MNFAEAKTRRSSVLIGITLALLAPLFPLAPSALAQDPVPFINQPLVPDATAPGGPQFTLTVNGTGFVTNSTVNWNGSPLTTTFVSGSQLTAVVPAADIATANTGWVTVFNPAPGGGTSNTAFFTVTPNAGGSIGFNLISTPNVNAYFQSMATGDFNGDGNLDLAFPSDNDSSGAISVLLGDGQGNFTLQPFSYASPWPWALAVGDFNKDGKLDLAVASSNYGATVSILLGDGTGNFTLTSSIPVSVGWTNFIVTGDFNGDGNLDLAVGGDEGASVSILLGDGTGNFTVTSNPQAADGPFSIAEGDFNGDGNLDLAVACIYDSVIAILLGDGKGNFTSGPWVLLNGTPAEVVTGDFNRDGILDLAVGDPHSNTVSILLGDGTGNFNLTQTIGVPYTEGYLAVADLNGDGNLDLAVAGSSSYPSTVTLLMGDGTGHFTLGSSPAAGEDPSGIVAGDFNGDGKMDLAVSDYGSNSVSALLQVPPYPIVTLYPTSFSFGTQLIFTTSSSQGAFLTNAGSAPLEITSITAGTNSSQSNDCGSSLAVGASCTINVAFQPHGIGALTGTVTITDNASNSPQTISLTGIGTVVGLRPASLNFGNQPVGTTSPARTINLVNRGNFALSISGVRFYGPDPGDFAETNTCGSSVPAGGSCTLSITFTPKAKGSRTATFGVADNGGGSLQTVTVSGNGT